MSRPFLIGERIYIRVLEESDVTERYVGWLNDQEVTYYLEGTGHFPTTPESLRAYLKRFQGNLTDLIFAIVDRQSDLHIGNVTLNRIHWIHRKADTGILIGDKKFQGKGYAVEAWGLLLPYAFGRLGLQKVIAGVIADNLPCIKVLERLGFKQEGILRREVWVDGSFRDVFRYGILREEFSPRASWAEASQGAAVILPEG